MYSNVIGIQILISLLKKHGIDNIVISAGQSNSSFARSVEHDTYFHCYSVVDERSAAFFAIGLALEINKPVAISCTASTACCNYISAITEAYYRGIPILVLTSNYDIRRVDQMKLLAIHQETMFKEITKKEVQLPEVNGKRNYDYCQRLINEAILELNHHGKGPVHIDVPSYDIPLKEECDELPETRAIYRYSLQKAFGEFALQLYKYKVMVICGQAEYNEQTIQQLEILYKNYGCAICGEHYSNIHADWYMNINPVISTFSKSVFKEFKPDIIITLGKHVQFDWYYFEDLGIEHWHVSEDGAVCDHFNSLTTIFECDMFSFLYKMNSCFADINIEYKQKGYAEVIKEHCENIVVPDVPLSHVYCIQKFCEVVPENSIIHMSVFNSIRITQYFKLPSSVRCYANYGALGIDGCMSTLIGQAAVFEGLSFMIIGDLSFFYDMNSLMIRHIRNNVRILLLNNSGGAEFYQNNGWYDTLDLHTAAAHSHSARGWAEETGFIYMSAESKEEFQNSLPEFVGKSKKPILLEVFTNLKDDEMSLRLLKDTNKHMTGTDQLKQAIKNTVGEKGVATIKKIIRKQ